MSTPDLETMPLADLRKLALEEDLKEETRLAEEAAAEAAKAAKKERTRDAQGRFVKEDGTVDDDQQETEEEKTAREAAEAAAEAEREKNADPEEFVIRRSIDLGDGSGIQVFVGKGADKEAALEDLNDKFYEAQVNASKKIREQAAQLRTTKQSTEDEEYVLAEKLKTKPKETIRELLAQERREQEESVQRSLKIQEDFVNTHPDYIGDTSNGARIRDWVQSHGYTEFTEENLEKAYQDLKASGLLKIKTSDAGGTTDAAAKEAERIAQAQRDAAQSRSSQRSSSVSTRGGTPVVKTEPTEDELYNMPLDKLKQLSNEQLAKAQS